MSLRHSSTVLVPEKPVEGRLLLFRLCLVVSLLGTLSSRCPRWVLTLGVILAGVDSSVGRDGGGQGAHTLRLSSRLPKKHGS